MTTSTLPPLHVPPPAESTRPRQRRRLLVAFLVILLAVAVLGIREWRSQPADIRSGTTLVDAAGMAASYGIHVDLIAVTAAGGMIEFRYQVVDPDKADRIVHDEALAPALINEETGQTLIMNSPPHHHGAELALGGTYFFLMANAANAVRRGTKLTLVIGDKRLEHIEAAG